MKKPNITEGEWYATEDGVFSNYKKHGNDVAQWTLPVDAKAISAVPEMIYALIEARQEIITMDNCITMNHQNYNVEAIKSIDKALKKAGVEL